MHKYRGGRQSSCPQNSWFPRRLVRKTQCPRHRRTSTHLDWLSSRYAHEALCVGLFYRYIPQVLTGQAPFGAIRQSALAHHVLGGKRPGKPENASAIGFSDPLWDFTRRCWDGEMELRPKVGEVVTHLTAAAASRNQLMPPHSHVRGAGAAAPKETSDPKESKEVSAWLFKEPHDDLV